MKKVRRNEHYTRKQQNTLSAGDCQALNEVSCEQPPNSRTKKRVRFSEMTSSSSLTKKIDRATAEKKARFERKLRVQKSSRNLGLQEANAQEDVEIHRLETLLKMNKRKKTTTKLPKYFQDDGLDCILLRRISSGLQ